LEHRERAVKITQSTWSPFQSRQVQEVCAHLTPEEHTQLVFNARQFGSAIGRWAALPFGLTAFLFSWSLQAGSVALILFIGYFCYWAFPRLNRIRQENIDVLCKSEWARNQGFASASLATFRFPWTK
jgi:hypothetical protein